MTKKEMIEKYKALQEILRLYIDRNYDKECALKNSDEAKIKLLDLVIEDLEKLE